MNPSSSAIPSHATEVWMPGAHGDIGGAEADDVVTETYTGLPRFLVDRGWFDEARRVVVREGRGNRPDFVYTIKDVQPNIGTATLHAMHYHAEAAQVPIKPLSELSGAYRKPMSTLLGQAAGVMEAGADVPEALCRTIRARHVHKSYSSMPQDNRLFYTRRRRYPNGG